MRGAAAYEAFRRGAAVRRSSVAASGADWRSLLVPGAACRKTSPERTLEVLVPPPPGHSRPVRRLAPRRPQPLHRHLRAPRRGDGVRHRGRRSPRAGRTRPPTPGPSAFPRARPFHDGTPVTSRDVVDAARASRASRGSLAGLADLKSIEVVDERTVRFRTHRPAEDFLLTVSRRPRSPREAGRDLPRAPGPSASSPGRRTGFSSGGTPAPAHARPLLRRGRLPPLLEPGGGPPAPAPAAWPRPPSTRIPRWSRRPAAIRVTAIVS